MSVVVFRADDDGLWYWQIKSSNGVVIGESMAGYAKKDRAIHFARRIVHLTPEALSIIE